MLKIGKAKALCEGREATDARFFGQRLPSDKATTPTRMRAKISKILHAQKFYLTLRAFYYIIDMYEMKPALFTSVSG